MSSDKILNMFDTVMKSDMTSTEKLAMVESLTLLHRETQVDAELAHDYEEATTPSKETFKVTLKPTSKTGKGNTVYGHKRWMDADRKELFTAVKSTFGMSDQWEGLVTPTFSNNYTDVVEQLAEHFDRTPLAIKSQLRDVVQPCKNAKNEKSIRIAKKLAYEAGLINEEVLNS